MEQTMKKNMLVIATSVFVLVLALAGCSSGGASSASSSESSVSTSAEASASAESSSVESSESAEVGIPNPWSDVNSAEEAAAGAGIDSFILPEGVEIGLGTVDFTVYRCMDGLAEAIDEFPAVEMTIRKGTAEVAEDGDISGDYGQYKKSWTQNIKGLEVTCFGNREGDATKTIWESGDYCYSITAYGLGGDDDFGLSADDLNSLINSMQ